MSNNIADIENREDLRTIKAEFTESVHDKFYKLSSKNLIIGSSNHF